jgi:hypothetical protein
MRVRLLIGLGFAVALALVALAGQLVFTIQRTTPTSYDLPFQLPEPADLIEGVDKSVGMMFSLTLGLFVAAGYALREVGAASRKSLFTLMAAAVFLFGSIASIYMGFMARNVALYYASFRHESAVSLSGTFIVLQGLSVAVAGLCTTLLLAEAFLGPPEAKKDEP